MAEVYKGYHPGLDRYVAIKVLHPFLADEEDFLARFQREAQIVATFRHPNIVQVYDFEFDAENNLYYMVMEFVDGPSLKTRLREIVKTGEGIPLQEAIHIIIEIAKALDYAHQHGMVHRDIKPANIMFTQDGQVILSDFGIAKIVDTTTLTASGAMVGTPAYMAPEQGIGQAGDERSDIYSLGVVLYQLITGTLPFDADTPLGIVLKHINAPLILPTKVDPDLPASIETVVIRALAKGPNNRYQTAREFADDLERALNGKPIDPISPECVMKPAIPDAETMLDAESFPHTGSLERSTEPVQMTRPRTRIQRKWITALAAILFLVITLGIGMLLTNSELADHLLAALQPATETASPSVTYKPTSTATPNPAATQSALSTHIAAGLHAELATRDARATYQATVNATSTSTPMPNWTATALAACVFDMEIVKDRAVQPSVLKPGQEFEKRWTVQNTGTCPWPEDVQLIFASGDELEAVTKVGIARLSPEETTEITIRLEAPANYGDYISTWQIQDGEGQPIGEDLRISSRVGPTPTPPPTPTSTPTPTPEFTATPSAPVRIESVGIVPGTFQRLDGGQWEADVYVVARGGNGEYRFYRDQISPETEFFTPNPDEPWVGVYHGARWEICKKMWISFWVTSAGMRANWDHPIPYPEEDKCP